MASLNPMIATVSVENLIAGGGSLFGLLGAAWALYANVKSSRHHDDREKAAALKSAQDELIMTKDSIITTMKVEKADWIARYDELKKSHEAYRVEAHDRISDAQDKILKLADENSQLHAKTDMTPVLKNQVQQNDVNAKVLDGLNTITKVLRDMLAGKTTTAIL